MEARYGRISILMLPWLAHGHVSPFFHLAKSLASRNFHIFFCSTPANLLSVKPKLARKLSSHIEFVELNLPTSPELPPHRHTTNGLPLALMSSLKRTFDMAAPAFSAILSSLNPDLLIYDFLQPWAPSLALSAGVPAVLFNVSGAVTPAIVMYKLKSPDSDFFSLFPETRLSRYGARQLNNMLQSSFENDDKDEERVLGCFERSCDVILVKSFREIEAKYIDSLSTLMDKKVVPVGPLVQDAEEDIKSEKIHEWLNGKEKSSSIFVSFGSEFYLSKENMVEIAHGLELSQVNFIWVVRFPGEERIDAEEELPQGFLERVRERGMVVENWAPQAQILSHPSIGGFMSHCGWGSVMESMKFGVPIIAVPMQLDQPLNSRLVEQLGVGVEVERDDDDGGLRREELARVVREVVVETNGEKVRKKMKEFAEMIKKKDDEEMDMVVEELVRLCEKKEGEGEHSQSNYRIANNGHCYKVMKKDDGAVAINGEPLCK